MTSDLQSLRIDHGSENYQRPRTSRLWMVLFFLLLLVSAGGFAFLTLRPTDTGGAPVRVERVRAPGGGDSASAGGNAFSASGWVKLPLRYPVVVTPLVEGRVEELLVVEGDRVEAGQLIARLYSEDLRAALAAASAKANAVVAELEKRRAGYRPQDVAAARAEVASLEAELVNARAVLENSRELQPSGAISHEELLLDESKVVVLEAALARAGERLGLQEEGFRAEDIRLTEAELESARAQETIARLRLSYAEVTSPIAGVVIERQASAGQWITPRDGALVSLYDPADLEVRVDVSQDDLGRVFVGQRVELSSRAETSAVYPGRVILIEPLADIVKNTVPVRVRIEDPEGKPLYPDMVVRARFLERDAPEVAAGGAEPRKLTVPLGAVVTEGDSSFVFVVREGTARRVGLTLGELEGGRYEVLSGLTGGERIVTRGAEGLTDGARVQIQQ